MFLANSRRNPAATGESQEISNIPIANCVLDLKFTVIRKKLSSASAKPPPWLYQYDIRQWMFVMRADCLSVNGGLGLFFKKLQGSQTRNGPRSPSLCCSALRKELLEVSAIVGYALGVRGPRVGLA